MSTTNDTVEILLECRRKLREPVRLTRGAYARDAAGRRVNARSPAACCWCAMGVVFSVSGYQNHRTNSALSALSRAASRFTGLALKTYSDRLGHLEVLGLFDEAITELEVPRWKVVGRR